MGGTRNTSLQLLLLYVVLLVCANIYTCVVVGLDLGSANAADIKCIDRERHALLMIKKDLVDEYGHLSSSGDEEGDCCNWRGIKCNNQTGHITMLDLRVTFDFDHQPLKGFDDYALVSWKGRIYEYGSTLGLVKSIDLSSNKLIGEIPFGITNLSGLLSLNLSRNNLVGLIPLDIGLLAMLESLDLSRNRLFGEIPGSMSDLNSLSFLDLSNKNLTGKIPSSTQLQSFETSAFVGNPALCGPPLTKKCPGDYTNQGPPTSTINEDAVIQKDEDEFVLDRWFYASVSLGFIVGFWGVCGTLILYRSWRHAYFRFFDSSKDWLYVRIAVHAARMRRKIHTRFDRFL